MGREVRQAISKLGGIMPENLAPVEDIKKIKSDLKNTSKGFLKKDKEIKELS